MSQLPTTMQAVRIHPDLLQKYSSSHPAPVSALHIHHHVPIPKPSQPDEVLVRVNAATIVRDMLTWPEMLEVDYYIPGSDFSGTVISTLDQASKFKPGDEVFGFVYFSSQRSGTWAEYAVVKADELAMKPKSLSSEEAASVSLSALTAYQCLFTHGGCEPYLQRRTLTETIPSLENRNKQVLILGATGAVGLWLVQMTSRVGVGHVVAATSSPQTSTPDLLELGASEVIDYTNMNNHSKRFDLIIDTVGQKILPEAWDCAAPGGTIVSVDSFTYDFVKLYKAFGNPREDVKGVWFIVKPDADGLSVISKALEDGQLKTFVSQTFPLSEVRSAYEAASVRLARRGKVVLTIP